METNEREMFANFDVYVRTYLTNLFGRRMRIFSKNVFWFWCNSTLVLFNNSYSYFRNSLCVAKKREKVIVFFRMKGVVNSLSGNVYLV